MYSRNNIGYCHDASGLVVVAAVVVVFSRLHTLGRMAMESTRRVLGHSLVHSRRSLIRLLHTVRFSRALRRAQSFARALTHSLRSSWETGFFICGMNASIPCHFNPLHFGHVGCFHSSLFVFLIHLFSASFPFVTSARILDADRPTAAAEAGDDVQEQTQERTHRSQTRRR